MSENSENKIRGSTEDEELKRIFSTNLNMLMRQRHISTSELAKELDISRQAVHKWTHGLALPRSGTLQQISEALLCSMNDLIKENIFDLDGDPDEESITEQLAKLPGVSKAIPIYDSVSCGKGGFIDEDIIDTLKLPEEWLNSSSSYFANKAQGDSMEPLIQNGDYLIFQRADVVPIGEVGAFSLNGEYFCKRLKKFNDGSLWLISDNPDYAPIPIKRDDDFRYLGKFSFKILKVAQ